MFPDERVLNYGRDRAHYQETPFLREPGLHSSETTDGAIVYSQGWHSTLAQELQDSPENSDCSPLVRTALLYE